MLDSNELNKIFVEFIKNIQFMEDIFFKDILSFDGKVDRGSARNKGYIIEETKPLNVLNVYSDKLQMCIDQEIIEEKTSEISAIPKIIERLDLSNVICTWEALNTQKENIKAVVSKGGDYCVALKDNQGNFYKDVQDYFDEDRIEEMKIEFVSDCDVLEEDELIELFKMKEKSKIADEIKRGLTEAIEYEKGNLDLRTTTLTNDE